MAITRVTKTADLIDIKRTIISVSDKDGLDYFTENLLDIIPDLIIYSTGGTYSFLKKILKDKADKHLIPVSTYTGQPEMEGGLVKTLDYKIYLGILSEKYNPAHDQDLRRAEALPIDMIVVNLYPFEETIARENIIFEDARGNIDIGGPCMLRAASKNFLRVLPVCSPGMYKPLIQELRETKGRVSLATRFSFAKKGFNHTASYDTAIKNYLSKIDLDYAVNSYTLLKD